MPLPLVSIVVAARDEERFIEDALDSALGQTYRNVEVIVVDDGSRDATPAIVETRLSREPRLRLLRESGRGVAAARNRGIADANGEFIAPLDADDVWDPTKIERQVQRMLERGSRTGIVYCWWLSIDAAGHVLDSSPGWNFEGDGSRTLFEINYVGNASVPMFRRSLLLEVGGYDESFRERDAQGCEDWDVALKIAERCEIGVVAAPLVAYRRKNASMSTRVDEMWRSHALLVDAARRRSPELTRATIARSRAQFAMHLAGVCFWSGRYARATAWVARALPSSTAFRMLPAIASLISRMLFRRPGWEPEKIEPGMPFGRLPRPEPLMPYDRIYRNSR